MPSATIAEKKLLAAVLLAVLVACGLAVLPGRAHAADATSAGGASAPTAEESESTEAEGASSEPMSEAEAEEELDGVSLTTWYGPGLFGRHTACGQLLTKRTVGVANRTLPCGTLVEMRYDGTHLTVPVIDRGPYGSIGANWDLTEAAAKLLHMPESEPVKAKIVGHVKNTAELGSGELASTSRVAHGSTGGTGAA
jgi:rare lipoprotein A (peptidoglycan hydrolase)